MVCVLGSVLGSVAASGWAQSTVYELDAAAGDPPSPAVQTPQPDGQANEGAGSWVLTEAPEEGSDAAIIGEARRALANERPRTARRLMNRWIKANERTRNPYMAEALLLRGDAKVAMRDEFKALYDYEQLILDHPESPAFVTAIERELEIATRYVNGMRRKTFGVRIEDASDIGEELLIRVQERLPGSRLAERAGIELADHYYREREMTLASEAYELFLVNYPESQHRKKALQRRVYANIARFKGPRYDASGLREAKALIRDFEEEYPIDAERTGLNSALTARLDESIAAQMLESAKWSLQTGDEPGARYTLRRLLRAHPRSVAATAALQVMDARGWSTPSEQNPARAAGGGGVVGAADASLLTDRWETTPVTPPPVTTPAEPPVQAQPEGGS